MFVGLDQLRSLILFFNVNQLSPGIFRGLSKLERLDIRHCEISVRKEIFRDAPNLIDLNLGDNSLPFIEPDFFACLPNLTRLDLSDTGLVIDTKTFIFLGNLKSLNLQNNNIRLADGVFAQLVLLEQLLLGKNQIREIRASMFMGLEKLKLLCLKKNKLESVPFDVIETLKCLKFMDLTENLIDEETIQELEINFPYIDFGGNIK